jgi:NAD(P)-dependent dehydrogenase (short-subunit alcohol dehydrogenase family)
MTHRFAGQTVLVTGGSRGIGRGIARAFAREGATVVVAGRDAEALTETVRLIEHSGGRAAAVAADITKADDAARLVRSIVADCGSLDIAVNNAGVFAGGPVADVGEAAWADLLAVNLTGVWLSMKQEIGQMLRHGGGVIVNISSNIGAHVTYPGTAGYAASKAGVSALTRAAAQDYIGRGIRINAVSPGASDTPMSLQPGETESDRAARLRSGLPIGRVGRIDEISAAVLWLASAEASFVVGHDLVVDGGAAA